MSDLTLKISDELCYDVLTTAVESGSGYWLACDSIERDAELHVTKVVGPYDLESDGSDPHWADITIETIKLGIQRIADPKFNINSDTRSRAALAIIEDDACHLDADDADCILQAGLFNELVYG